MHVSQYRILAFQPFTEHTSIAIQGTFFSKSQLTFWGPEANYNVAPGYGAGATAQRRLKS